MNDPCIILNSQKSSGFFWNWQEIEAKLIEQVLAIKRNSEWLKVSTINDNGLIWRFWTAVMRYGLKKRSWSA